MTDWVVAWTDSARKYHSKMDAELQARVNEAVEELRNDPYAVRNSKRLRGPLEGLCRYRVGKFRMIYRVVAEANEVRILAIGSRGDIY